MAFAAVDVFELKRLFVTQSAQQPLVDWTMLFADIGLGSVMLALAVFMVWRLVDLLRRKGGWQKESGTAPEGAR